MKVLKIIIGVLALIGIWTGGYMIGHGHGEMKIIEILFLERYDNTTFKRPEPETEPPRGRS